MKNLQELPRLSESISYLYIEHAILEQDAAAIVAIREDGRIPIPIAAVTCLLLGPGIKITHAAVRTACDNGCMLIWCGEGAGRFYASGIGETRSSKNLLIQAKVVMDDVLHMEAVRRMYTLRFPNIRTEGLTLQQIRGMEGIRVRKCYELFSKTTGVKWRKRSYKSESWEYADDINRALSESNALLYGLCHAAIVTLGYSPGLGLIHTGKQLSFVYDVADLYKTETTIPVAFEAVRLGGDIHKSIREMSRKTFANCRILSRIPGDLEKVFHMESLEENDNARKVGGLWGEAGELEGGINYAHEATV